MGLKQLVPHTSTPNVLLYIVCVSASAACGLIATWPGVTPLFFLVPSGVVISALLIGFPEVALAIFLAAGSFKGDPRLSFLGSVDLTVALGVLLAAALAVKVLMKREPIRVPRPYILYAPFVLTMLISLFYTPDFAAGLDKTLRFVILTGIAILSPFAFLDSPQKLNRFLLAVVGRVFVIAFVALSKLSVNSYDRLVSPSGDNLSLGYQSVTALAIFLLLVWSPASFRRKAILIPIPMVLVLTLVGSGARGAFIAACCCICVGILLSRKLIADVALIGLLGVLSLFIVSLPTASYRYLSQLVTKDASQNLGERSNLMALAMHLTVAHPLGGVGIGGYPSYSPHGSGYNYPHNVILEISAELGILEGAVVISLIAMAFWATAKQVTSSAFPYKSLSQSVLMLLLIGFLTLSNAGDLNDNRQMWLYMGLPYLLTRFERQMVINARPAVRGREDCHILLCRRERCPRSTPICNRRN